MKKQQNLKFVYIVGLFLVCILYSSVMLLGDNAVFVMHDQFDGEVLTYIFRAENLFADRIAQLFDGVKMSALTPPAPGFVLFYMLFDAQQAFMICYAFVVFAAFTGMFLCIQEMFENGLISVVVAVLFSILPFYSVYGLSVMGQPLLLYAILLLWKGKKKYTAYGIVFVFASCSSLVLVGYADLILMTLALVYLFIRKHPAKLLILIAYVEMIVIYVILNFSLLMDMFIGSDGFQSHKNELMISAEPVKENFWQLFEKGQYHAASVHSSILFIVVIGIFCVLTKLEELDQKNRIYFAQMLGIMVFAIGVAAFYAIWKYEPVVNLRNRLGGFFVSFQVDRFYWLYPLVWFLMLGYILYFIPVLYRRYRWMMLLTVLVVGSDIWSQSNVKVNFEKWAYNQENQPGYVTWEEFYQPDLFEEIREYIDEPVSEYRVGSVGLYPSIALYNGFYCIDGYSNNYDVAYKHEFRNIIAGELDKDEALKKYFDDWGNRCYLFSSEIPFQYFIKKDNTIQLKNLDFNMGQMQKMNCQYLFSTVEIMHKELELEKKFTEDDSLYSIYLYKVVAD